MRSHLVDLITNDTLQEMADGGSYQRGVAYYRQGRVHSLSQKGNRITATVEGSEEYDVEIWIEGGELEAECDCPVGMDGWFCKHCVAVGLAWLNTPQLAKKESAKTTKSTQDIKRYLEQKEKSELVQMILDRVAKDSDWQDSLLLKAAAASPKGIDLKAFQRALDSAIQTNNYIEYGEERSYTKKVQKVLDSIAELLELGQAEGIIELCESAVKKLEKVEIDDSYGYLGELLNNVQELHQRACEIAKPDPVALAERLFKLEMNTECDAFYSTSGTYSEILGETGIKHYRKLVEKAWKALPEVKPGQQSYDSKRWHLTNLMEDIARQTGDIDAIVAIKIKDLSQSSKYLQIAELYAEAGKPDLAIQWANDGLAAFPEYRDYRIRTFLIEQYKKQKRFEDAIALAWTMFTEAPRLDNYQLLKSVSDPAKQWKEQRERAIAHLRDRFKKNKTNTKKQAYDPFAFMLRDNSLLVEMFLWEGEIDAAWEEAKAHGCSQTLWLQVADQRQKTHPEDALSVYLQHIEPYIQQTNNESYAKAIALVKKSKELMLRLGLQSQYQQYSEHLQKTYKSKRNFMKLMFENKL